MHVLYNQHSLGKVRQSDFLRVSKHKNEVNFDYFGLIQNLNIFKMKFETPGSLLTHLGLMKRLLTIKATSLHKSSQRNLEYFGRYSDSEKKELIENQISFLSPN